MCVCFVFFKDLIVVDFSAIFTIIVVDVHRHVHQAFAVDGIEMLDEVVVQATTGIEIAETRPRLEIVHKVKVVLHQHQIISNNKIMHHLIFSPNTKLLNRHTRANRSLQIMIMCRCCRYHQLLFQHIRHHLRRNTCGTPKYHHHQLYHVYQMPLSQLKQSTAKTNRSTKSDKVCAAVQTLFGILYLFNKF